METGLQFHLPSHSALSVPKMVELGRMAADGGLSQLWVSDNLGSRNPFVVLAALAGQLPVKLGTAIMVQYFRNPVDAADSLATITELMQGDELCVGIGRGNVQTSRFITTPSPVSTMRETAQCLRRLLDGGEVHASAVPALASYFNYAPDAKFKLAFPPAAPVLLYCGGDGPKSLALGGEFMDGLLCGTTFLAITKMGYLDQRLRIFDEAAAVARKTSPRRCVVEIKISLSRSAAESREFARQGVGSRVLALRWRGFSDDDLMRLGIDPQDVQRLEEAGGGGTSAELADLVTDAMIDAFYVAGSLGYCRERMAEIRANAATYGVDQILFSGISRDFQAGLQLLCDHILPDF